MEVLIQFDPETDEITDFYVSGEHLNARKINDLASGASHLQMRVRFFNHAQRTKPPEPE